MPSASLFIQARRLTDNTRLLPYVLWIMPATLQTNFSSVRLFMYVQTTWLSSRPITAVLPDARRWRGGTRTGPSGFGERAATDRVAGAAAVILLRRKFNGSPGRASRLARPLRGQLRCPGEGAPTGAPAFAVWSWPRGGRPPRVLMRARGMRVCGLRNSLPITVFSES